MDKKRKQHFVFQAYLNAWTVNNEIWCVYNYGKPFNTSTINVAQERDFYRIKPLNEQERKLLEIFFSKCDPNIRRALLDHVDTYLYPLKVENKIQTLTQKVGGLGNIPDEIKVQFSELEKDADIYVNDSEENYLGDIEGESIQWINSLKAINSDFYYMSNKGINNNDFFNDEQFNFLFFLCTQYFRTKAIKKRWISSVEPCLSDPKLNTLNVQRENISLENLAHHFFWFSKISCAYNLRRKNSHLTILVNNTGIPFITSDQPVINLKADYKNPSSETTELIFYYPIAPNIAITVNDDNSVNKIELNAEQVNIYNFAILDSSYQNIFANCSDILYKYKIARNLP